MAQLVASLHQNTKARICVLLFLDFTLTLNNALFCEIFVHNKFSEVKLKFSKQLQYVEMMFASRVLAELRKSFGNKRIWK